MRIRAQVNAQGVAPARFSFLHGLLLLFIGLKLAGVIGWSWWWVLSPIWIVFVIAFAVGALATWIDIRRSL